MSVETEVIPKDSQDFRGVADGARVASRVNVMLSTPIKKMGSALGALAVVAGGLLSVGCGTSPVYEADYPQQYVAPPAPATAAELSAQQQARAQEAQDSREVLIGENADEYADTDPGALTEFKPALEGHGTWVQDPTYGTVWVPASAEVGTDFQPYVTAGHWTYSDSTDYVWVSDYEWGWAPFHYGRWVYLPGHGWSWIPGRRYAGAWVVWRTGPAGYGYVGWAPAPPEWYWYDGYAVGWSFGWYHYHDYYAFCPHDHFYHSHGVATYVVRGPAAREHYGRTHDYVPASPGVGGGGDRHLANPTVGGPSGGAGGQRVVANPSVNKGLRGPRPDEIGNKDMVVAPPSSHQGLDKAQAFATPKTAVAAGGAAPQGMRSSSNMMGVAPSSNLVPGSSAAAPNSRGPASAAFVPRSPNAPTSIGTPSSPGAERTPMPSSHVPVATSPQYRSPSGAIVSTPTPRYSGSSSMTAPSAPPSTSSFSSSSSFARTDPRPSAGSSTFRSSTSSSPPPSFRSSSPSISSSPSMRSSASQFHSSSPSPSPPVMRSAPPTTFRSSSPAVQSPTFRSSSPSVSSPRPSTPSNSAHRSGTFKKR